MDATLVEALRELSETPALIWPIGAGFFGWLVWKFSPNRTRDPVKRSIARTCGRSRRRTAITSRPVRS